MSPGRGGPILQGISTRLRSQLLAPLSHQVSATSSPSSSVSGSTILKPGKLLATSRIFPHLACKRTLLFGQNKSLLRYALLRLCSP